MNLESSQANQSMKQRVIINVCSHFFVSSIDSLLSENSGPDLPELTRRPCANQAALPPSVAARPLITRIIEGNRRAHMQLPPQDRGVIGESTTVDRIRSQRRLPLPERVIAEFSQQD